MTERHEQRATGHTDVKSYVPTTFDEPAEGPKLIEIQLTETFTGDVVPRSGTRDLRAGRIDRRPRRAVRRRGRDSRK
jgi:hypothetical protein